MGAVKIAHQAWRFVVPAVGAGYLGLWLMGRPQSLAAGALLAFLFATLGDAAFAGLFLLPVAGGFAALLAAFVFHLLTRHGVRAAFDRFDVIRDFNPRKASRLPHRGGRR